MFDSGRTTVLILPLLAMHDEYVLRAKKHGISCETWSCNSRPAAPPQLLLVAVEYGGWKPLAVYLETLIHLGHLTRLVIDEAHQLLKHEEFRECVNLLQHLGQFPIPIVLITATLPSTLEQKLFSKVGRQLYRVLRRSTERPEISHMMVPLNQTTSDIEGTVAYKIKELTKNLKGDDRALLFCVSRAESDRMAQKLQWKPYHSDISLTDRSQYMQQWRSGIIPGLACTSMLNCCLDYPAVRFIFHLGVPRDAIDYWQAIGRGSRDGCRGESIVYFQTEKCRKITGEDLYGQGAMHETLRDNSTCRRLRISLFLDGTATPCTMLPHGQLCDVCETQTSQSPPADGPTQFPAHLLPPSSLTDETLSDSNPPSTVALFPIPECKRVSARSTEHLLLKKCTTKDAIPPNRFDHQDVGELLTKLPSEFLSLETAKNYPRSHSSDRYFNFST